MRIAGLTFLFALLLLGLGYYTIRVVPPKIEASIAAEIEQKFAANKLPQLKITMNGRDVSLAGNVNSQAQIDLAMKLASHNTGVRSVMTSMVVIAEQGTTGSVQPQQNRESNLK